MTRSECTFMLATQICTEADNVAARYFYDRTMCHCDWDSVYLRLQYMGTPEKFCQTCCLFAEFGYVQAHVVWVHQHRRAPRDFFQKHMAWNARLFSAWFLIYFLGFLSGIGGVRSLWRVDIFIAENHGTSTRKIVKNFPSRDVVKTTGVDVTKCHVITLTHTRFRMFL